MTIGTIIAVLIILVLILAFAKLIKTAIKITIFLLVAWLLLILAFNYLEDQEAIDSNQQITTQAARQNAQDQEITSQQSYSHQTSKLYKLLRYPFP